MKITKNEDGTYNLSDPDGPIEAIHAHKKDIWDILISKFKNRDYKATRQMFCAMDKENQQQFIKELCLAKYDPGLKYGELANLIDILID